MYEDVKTIEELAIELEAMSNDMFELGCHMGYYDGFSSDVREKGIELVGASKIAMEWVKEMKKLK